ncbi:MAG: two-component sensor histidine kinase [Spirochaetaceae bacterium]|jgi:two-component system phosphate regulon sensor histidine kinase PhoR|nr:two-component sensor histidine kinase [Spirochaetaceae bacterium]
MFYHQLTKSVVSDIEKVCKKISSLNIIEIPNAISIVPSAVSMRITLVSQNGTVIFDSAVPADMLENHIERTEIQQAIKTGTGKSKRFSSSLGSVTWYYAVRLENGSILRVSKTYENIVSLIKKAFIFMLIVILLTIILSYFITDKLAFNIERYALQTADLTKTEKMRREFSANVSHELKTPLTSISGYAQMLEGGMVKENDKPLFIKKIKDESERLITLLDDIMLLSHLDEAPKEESFEDVDLYLVLSEAIENLQNKALKNDVRLNLSGESAVIKAHWSMLLQLFVNLIDNAVKYNKTGGAVYVTISKTNTEVSVTVEDTGIGIPEKSQGRVFERFYRVDKSRSKKTGGTGLGLAIVKHIAIIHNAKILLESREGEGTKVTLDFEV